MVNQKELGQRIKQIRESKNMTQYALHEKTYISTTQLSAYENGHKNMGLQTLAIIAEALDVTLDELYYGSDSKKPITKSKNKGELIVNCVSALFDKKVIVAMLKENRNDYVGMGAEYYYQIGFNEYVNILNDMVIKLDDFEKNRNNYPDPESFKKQILASAAKQINEFGLK